MYNGTLDTADVLLNRGLNGGYGYSQFIGDGSAVKESVRGNRDLSIVESINRTGSDRALSNQLDRQGEFLTDRINVAQVNDQFGTLERLLFSIQNDTQRDLANIATKQAECCCELRAGQAAILAEIKCNRDVQEARQEGLNQAKLDAVLASVARPGNS